ncbi:hypothetical protein GE21DRAFT_8535 [Neurospora crassa]|uniref:Uncharacterized protein n=1 Tax=Neurospora crassa (strain ATCC 24698 / 74-OR23-1A / CBS 708.71 / DSM 1257 / FGSC 987) TaxID=367110 RepID=V5INK1_NEUCR|nr:hypothetical protein NCU17053 [Neurospora crassa OR74A]ESA42739.1 hypothetical protein NCU17053 [Neurospora crassa OR74A]KHE85823.1 hypothetical protein GE21DRAFT_8535 [Neurospora crassa]|eukprot:XP_011394863.1 hypothetical protein NCU17053 [Neurospora crassa OR74A]
MPRDEMEEPGPLGSKQPGGNHLPYRTHKDPAVKDKANGDSPFPKASNNERCRSVSPPRSRSPRPETDVKRTEPETPKKDTGIAKEGDKITDDATPSTSDQPQTSSGYKHPWSTPPGYRSVSMDDVSPRKRERLRRIYEENNWETVMRQKRSERFPDWLYE